MPRRFALLLAAGMLLIWSASAQALMDWTFGVLPTGGAVSGAPGSTVGWGYTIANLDTTNWLLLSGISADPFLNGTADSNVFDFPIVAPGATVTVPYDGLNGLYQLVWDGAAPVGFVNSGTFILNADWYNGDPFLDGTFLDFALDKSAAYSATVAGAPVPEPATLFLLGSGLAGVVVLRRKLNGITPHR